MQVRTSNLSPSNRAWNYSHRHCPFLTLTPSYPGLLLPWQGSDNSAPCQSQFIYASDKMYRNRSMWHNRINLSNRTLTFELFKNKTILVSLFSVFLIFWSDSFGLYVFWDIPYEYSINIYIALHHYFISVLSQFSFTFVLIIF